MSYCIALRNVHYLVRNDVGVDLMDDIDESFSFEVISNLTLTFFFLLPHEVNISVNKRCLKYRFKGYCYGNVHRDHEELNHIIMFI